MVTLTPKRNAAEGVDEIVSQFEAAAVPEESLARRDNRTGEFQEIFISSPGRSPRIKN